MLAFQYLSADAPSRKESISVKASMYVVRVVVFHDACLDVYILCCDSLIVSMGGKNFVLPM